MKISNKVQKMLLIISLEVFAFTLGFIFGSKIFYQNPIIINCPTW
jgi:hypothetical protein